MPISRGFDRDQHIELPQEIFKRDFEWRPGEWPNANFYSPAIGPADAPQASRELASHLNTMAGPFYVREALNQGHDLKAKIFYVVVFHPDDRKSFAAKYLESGWREDPIAALRNARLLSRQMALGFEPATPALASLTEELKVSSKPTLLTIANVDAAARNLWPTSEVPSVEWHIAHMNRIFAKLDHN